MMRTKRALLVILLCHALLLPLSPRTTPTPNPGSRSPARDTSLPGEKPEIAVNAHNVKQLEFRVYRVNDPVKFFSQMQELHNFGGQGPAMPKQAHTWLEKFHAWKHRIWAMIRDFIRGQFSPDSRHQIRLWQMGGGEPRKARRSQLTRRCRCSTSSKSCRYGSGPSRARAMGERDLTVPVSDKGVYLVEATDGKLRAYTIVVITDIAIITKAGHGRLMSFVVDRRSGDPIAGIPVQGLDRPEGSRFEDYRSAGPGRYAHQRREAGERCGAGDQCRTVRHQHARRWNLGDDPNRNLKGYTYTDRPVYRPGDTVHFKTIVRAQTASGYTVPQGQELRLEMRDPQTYDVIWTQTVKLSRHGHGALELRRSQPTPSWARTTSPCRWASVTSRAPTSRSRTTRSRNTR